MTEKEFNLSEKIKELKWDEESIGKFQISLGDVKEFIKRRIERTILICKLYPHKSSEELAGELNEDLIKDAGEKLI